MPPTAQHEALHRIFQHDEALFTRAVARVFNVMVPAPINVTVLGTDLTETEPMERRPDSVLQAEFMVEESSGKYILIIESQTKMDEERRRRWPHYIAHLHDKYECPVILAVVCTKRSTAVWARTRTYPFVSQMRQQGREEGQAQGLAKAIFKVLDRRGLEVDEPTRTRIESCGDVDSLDRWLDRSFVVASSSELFD